ncbi:uncharacterized protein EAE97_011089 [Botrytis byssoidea]|uniref:Cytochrome P450 alkane hydroxylase n=1 Tax=Botrytis byssoidea TaxID=139641 RepID=A0A9P5HWB9_9HELO|nr:uncharacterized protein EAE97_011089 [Botrytis byssoidea]KAF7922347.1 hypothetical protein EAE97_011089 [Botrytis byssoidea]
MGYLSDFGGAFLSILLVCYLVDAARLRARRKQFMRENDCEEPPKRPSQYPFGIDLFLNKMKNIKSHTHLESIMNHHKELGSTYTEKSIGTTTIFTIDPQNLQTYYSTNFKDYGVYHLRKKAFHPLLGDGVFSTDGPFWEHSRALIRPTFTRFNVANFPAFEIHLQKFLKFIPRDGKTVNLSSLLDDLFLATSTEFIFGESVNALDESSDESSESHKFLNAFHHAQRGISIRSQLRTLSFLYQDRWDKKERRAVHKFVDAHIDKALELRREFLASKKSLTNPDPSSSSDEEDEEEVNHRYILLHEMAKETDDRRELRNQTLQVFLAGHEATAIGVGNAIFWLWMRYLQWVVNETLRLTPIAPTITRGAVCDTILPRGGGPPGTSPILVKAGTLITPNSWVFHRLAPCYQPDPEAFRPERWEHLRPGWNYLPFGGGTRMCAGRNLGLTEMAYVLARLVQEWEGVECRDEVAEWVEEMKLSVESGNGVKVGVKWAG